VGLLLLALREGVLLPGSITVLLLLDAVALLTMRANNQAVQRDVIFSTVIVAGVAADLMLWRLPPAPGRPMAIRIFATAVPLVLFEWYFLAVAVHIGTWWTPHALTGMGVLGALTGLLISYLVFPRTEAAPQG